MQVSYRFFWNRESQPHIVGRFALYEVRCGRTGHTRRDNATSCGFGPLRLAPWLKSDRSQVARIIRFDGRFRRSDIVPTVQPERGDGEKLDPLSHTEWTPHRTSKEFRASMGQCQLTIFASEVITVSVHSYILPSPKKLPCKSEREAKLRTGHKMSKTSKGGCNGSYSR